jgi:hypothetical protein
MFSVNKTPILYRNAGKHTSQHNHTSSIIYIIDIFLISNLISHVPIILYVLKSNNMDEYNTDYAQHMATRSQAINANIMFHNTIRTRDGYITQITHLARNTNTVTQTPHDPQPLHPLTAP